MSTPGPEWSPSQEPVAISAMAVDPEDNMSVIYWQGYLAGAEKMRGMAVTAAEVALAPVAASDIRALELPEPSETE